MKIHMYWLMILGVGSVVEFPVAQEIASIVLLPDNCSTQCRCIFNYEVMLTETLPESSSFIFELHDNLSQTFQQLFTLKLSNDCAGFVERAEVFCTEIYTNKFIISINPKQVSRYRQSKARAYLRHFNTTTNYTQILNVTTFYNTLEATGMLRINGGNASIDNCHMSVNSSELTIEFECASADQPCVIEIRVDENSVVKRSENRSVVNGISFQKEYLLVTVKYAGCNLDEGFNTVSCRVATNFIPTDEEKFVLFLSIGLGFAIIFVFIIICVCVMCRRRRKLRKHETVLSISQPLINSDQQTIENETLLESVTRSAPEKTSIKRKANVDPNDPDVWTPLMLAANKGHASTVTKLLATGADVNATGPEELTALLLASENGHLSVVKKLLKNGAIVDGKDCQGWTSLMLASQNGHVDIVNCLIKHNAKVDERNNDDSTAVIIASENDQNHIVELLDELGSNHKNKNGKKLVKRKSTVYESRSACVMDNKMNANKEKRLDNDAILREFCKSMKRRDDGKDELPSHSSTSSDVAEKITQSDVPQLQTVTRDKGNKNNKRSEIIVAIENNSTEDVELIIKEGFDINKKLGNGSNVLIFAAVKGRTEIVDLLIKNKAGVNDTDNNGWTALLHASEHGHRDVINLLLENGAHVDKKENKNWTALMLAAQSGHAGTASFLIEKGASVNDRERKGWTALMLASLHGHNETIQLLADHGANLEEKEDDGWTALMQASLNGHVETVSLLLERGAKMSKNEMNGWTPLMLASQNGHSKVVKLLLDKGISVNDSESNGFTALMLASQNGHLETVRLLVDNGADVHAKNNDDWTALMLASDNGHDGIVDFLSK